MNDPSRCIRSCLGLAVLMYVSLLFTASEAFADGGKVQLSRVVDGKRISVFTSPTPLLAGPVDISVLVQDESTGKVVRGEKIEVRCRHSVSDSEVNHHASYEESTNKLMQSAKVELPRSGQWDITLGFTTPIKTALSFPVVLADSTTSLSGVQWLMILPFAFIALFFLRERILSTNNCPARPPIDLGL